MKILFLTHDSLSSPGGVPIYLSNLMQYFPESQVISFRNKNNGPIRHNEINFNSVNLFNEMIYFREGSIKILIDKIRWADIVHINPVGFFYIFLLFLSKLYNKKVVSTFHSNVEFKGTNWKKFLENFRYILVINICLLFANQIIFITNAQKEIILKFCLLKDMLKRKSRVIYNSIDLSNKFLRKKIDNKISIIFVGRLTKFKGFHDLISLINLLKKEDIEFTIIGQGDLKKDIPKLNNIKHFENVENSKMSEFYKKSNIFILPSYTEVFPMVILEAMSQGLVILTSNLPSLREIIKNHKNGYLFDQGDIIKMRDIVLYLKNNPKEIERISKNNIRDVDKFDSKKQLNKYKALYRRLLI